MRRINIAAFSLILFAVVSARGVAEGNGGGGGGLEKGVERSTTRLLTGITLTAAQTDSVKAINDRLATAAKAETGGDMRAKMTEMRTNQRTQLRAILTPDQQTVFDKNVADMDKARMNRPQP